MITLPTRELNYEYKAKVLNVVDGDTIDLLIDVGFNIYIKERVRLYGVNTPETRTKNEEEKRAGLKAKKYVSLHLSKDAKVKIETIKKGKYGRYLTIIWIPTSSETAYWNLNQALIDKGLAEEYYGGKRK